MNFKYQVTGGRFFWFKKKFFQLLSFTVIELLVAITIISMLVAILMPGLRGAKEQANSVKCMSNLRQIGTAIALFGNDTGCYPTGMPDAGKSYYSLLSVYLGGSIDTVSPVFECPSAKKPSSVTSVVSQYGLNTFIAMYSEGSPVTFSLPGGVTVADSKISARPYPLIGGTSELVQSPTVLSILMKAGQERRSPLCVKCLLPRMILVRPIYRLKWLKIVIRPRVPFLRII